MEQGYELIETCCGGAALTLHLLGSHRGLLPYQGGKWALRKPLTALLESRGFNGPPTAVTLTDCSYWGTAMGHVLNPRDRGGVIKELRYMARKDPLELYNKLHNAPLLPSHRRTNRVLNTAAFLFLQRLAFSGKAVGTRGNRWNSPGFNTSSAYGLAKTDNFGKVNPMVPSMIGVLEDLSGWLADVPVYASRTPARYPSLFALNTVAYIDPPYRGTTAYPDGILGRASVVHLALAWQAAGALVIVSEAEAVEELTGWTSQRLPKTSGKSPFRGSPEWVTISPTGSRS